MSSFPSTFTDPTQIRKQIQMRLQQQQMASMPRSTAPPAPVTPTPIPVSPNTTSTGRMVKDKTSQPPRMGMNMMPSLMPSFMQRMMPGPFGGGFPRGRMPPGGPSDFLRRFPERPFLLNPGHFRLFDHRFDDDRKRFNVFDFRREFDDDERRIFLPVILSFRGADIALVEHILGLVYDPSIAREGTPGPSGPGAWEIGVDGLWYKVTLADEQLIQTIEARRGEPHQALVI